MESPVTACINWITAKIYAEIFAESLQVMNSEERIDLLSETLSQFTLRAEALHVVAMVARHVKKKKCWQTTCFGD